MWIWFRGDCGGAGWMSGLRSSLPILMILGYCDSVSKIQERQASTVKRRYMKSLVIIQKK